MALWARSRRTFLELDLKIHDRERGVGGCRTDVVKLARGTPPLDQNPFGASSDRENSQSIASTIGELIVTITNL